jgi:hypothetical protein
MSDFLSVFVGGAKYPTAAARAQTMKPKKQIASVLSSSTSCKKSIMHSPLKKANLV